MCMASSLSAGNTAIWLAGNITCYTMTRSQQTDFSGFCARMKELSSNDAVTQAFTGKYERIVIKTVATFMLVNAHSGYTIPAVTRSRAVVAGWLCGSGWQGCGVGGKKWAAGIAQRGRTRTPSSLVRASTKGYVFSSVALFMTAERHAHQIPSDSAN